MGRLNRIRYFAAACFNAMFAVLATVTLLGIILVTRPQGPMHNVPPGWWIPLACLIIPGQLAVQFFTLQVIRGGNVPTPIEIAAAQPDPPSFLRPVLAGFWFSNYVIWFVILISLFKPEPNARFNLAVSLLLLSISSVLTSGANTHLMLFSRTLFRGNKISEMIWKCRHLFTILIFAVAMLYYFLGI